MTPHCDMWHQLEAADERAWLDTWARAQQAATALADSPRVYRGIPGTPVPANPPVVAQA